MALVGKTERRDIPGEDGEWIDFRKLTGGELDQAEEVQTQRSLAMVKGLDPAAVSAIRTDPSVAVVAAPDPAAAYDKATLVQYGVVAWSYGEDCNERNKKRLEAATRDWAASVAVEMNIRPPGSASGSNGSSPPDESAPNSESLTDSTPAE